MAKSNDNQLGAVTLISTKTQMTGNIETESDIRIDGVLHGNLTTNGRLIIGDKGKLVGEVRCKSAEIEGVFQGKLYVDGLLSLKTTANFEGEIETAQLQIETGAQFSGSCKMNRNDNGN